MAVSFLETATLQITEKEKEKKWQESFANSANFLSDRQRFIIMHR